MIRNALRSLLAEPRATDAPARVWRDWALIGVIAPIALIETALADNLVWPVVSVVVALGLLPTLLWRRIHPLAMLVVAFGTLTAVDAVSLMAGIRWEGLGTNVYVLVLVYALFRWGSGREGAIGLAVVAVPVVLSTFDPQVQARAGESTATNLIGGVAVLLMAAALGATFKFRDRAHVRDIDQAKLLEREQLARELHDTVAHHVSAIVIRAQAGRVVAAADPSAALDALAVIEEEASRTLAEMRTMVGALRDGAEAELTPQPVVADIARLARTAGDRLQVHVELSGDLDGMRPSIDTALYRLAQESITNAMRHARHATQVRVEVCGDAESVRLTVQDDGDGGAFDPRSTSGFGLIGMAERANLLGGTFAAGPQPGRGWKVDVVLPQGNRTA